MYFTANIFKHRPEDLECPVREALTTKCHRFWTMFPDLLRCRLSGSNNMLEGVRIIREAYSSWIQKLGLADGDCVALVSRNDIHYHILGHVMRAAGGVFAGINAAGKVSEMQANIASADAKWLFAEPQLLERAEAAVRNHGIDGSRILAFDAAPSMLYSGPLRKYSELLRFEESALKPYDGHRKHEDWPCL